MMQRKNFKDKSKESGITLTSLIIYVIAFMILIGIISSFTKYFYKNVNETVISNNTTEQYSRFMEFFTDDINAR